MVILTSISLISCFLRQLLARMSVIRSTDHKLTPIPMGPWISVTF